MQMRPRSPMASARAAAPTRSRAAAAAPGPPRRGFEPRPAHLRSCLLLSRAARGRRGEVEGGAVDRRAPKARPGPGGTEPSGRWDAFVWRCRGARAQRERRRGGGGGGGGGGRGRLRSGEKPPGTKSPPGCAPAAPRRAAPRTPCPRVRAALRVPAPRIGSANNARNPTRGAPGSAGMSDKRRRFPPLPTPPDPSPSPFPQARTEHKAFPAFPGSISLPRRAAEVVPIAPVSPRSALRRW